MDCSAPWLQSVAHHGFLSMEFSKKEYWSELAFPSPGYLPDPGTEAGSLTLQADSLSSEPPGKLLILMMSVYQCFICQLYSGVILSNLCLSQCYKSFLYFLSRSLYVSLLIHFSYFLYGSRYGSKFFWLCCFHMTHNCSSPTCPSSTELLFTFGKNQLTIYVWVYIWILFCTIYLFVYH